jgi:hypothetical protein
MRANLRVLRNFYQYPAAQMVTFGYNIAASLDPLAFPNLPVAPTVVKTLTDTLNTALQAKLTGGKIETAAKNTAFAALANALNSDANIVENTVGMNLEMPLTTGYLPVSTSRTSSPLDDTSIVALMNNGTTQALLLLQPIINAGVSGADERGRRQDVGGSHPLLAGAAHRASEPCAGHDV